MSPQKDHSAGGAGDRPLDPEKLLRAAAADSSADLGPSPWQPPTLAELAGNFPDLELIELIGRGGMGAVYRARQTRLDRTIALKVLPPELARDPAFEERFLREGRALAGLQHPRILTVHDFGERGGFFYLITEFIEGMNLRQLMDMGQLSPVEALRITPQICEALQFAHDHGVVHRDVKPENVLIDQRGDVKIADFGLARILGDTPGVSLTRSSQILGTPHYMAPEQWRHGVPIDHRADIYSVGVVLYEMLTGQLPLGAFEPASRQQGVPHGLDAVVQRSLAQQPDQRYQQASEVSDDLRQQEPAVGREGGSRARRAAPHGGGSGTDAPPAGMPGMLKLVWFVSVTLIIALAALAIRANSMNMQYEMQRHVWLQNVSEAAAWAANRGIDTTDLDDERLLARYYADMQVPAWEQRRRVALDLRKQFDEPQPTPPAPTEAHVNAPGAGLALLSTLIWIPLLLFPLVGFTAIRNIRRRQRGTAGLGLAVFTAWLVPLTIVIAIPTTVLAVNMNDSDLSLLASTITAVLLGIGGIVWMVFQHRRLAAEL